MANATTMPAITHVAVTVTDLAASEAWYTKVLGVNPVLDEDTGPFRHIVYLLGTRRSGCTASPTWPAQSPLTSASRGLTTSPSASQAAMSSLNGQPG